MSINRVAQQSQLQTSKPAQPLFRRAIVIYPTIGVLIVLVFAWFDGGEEPLRPIVQTVEQSEAGVSS